MQYLNVFTYIILLITSCRLSVAQGDKRVRQDQFSPVYFQTQNFVSDSIGKSRLDVSFRIPYDFFVSVANTSLQSRSAFIATGDITVEVLDHSNVSVARQLTRKQITTDMPLTAAARQQFLEGIFTFNLAPGDYSLVTEVTDPESQRHYFDNSRKVRLRNFSPDSLTLSDVLFFDVSSWHSSGKLLPLNFGSDVPFGKSFRCVAGATVPASEETLKVSYRLTKPVSDEGEQSILVQGTLPDSSILHGKIVTPALEENRLTYQISDGHAKGTYAFRININGDTLEEGLYVLEITAHAGKFTSVVQQKFHLLWFDKPKSLRNLRFAIDALEYIATHDEFKHLNSGNPVAQRRAFENFWKQRDKTPSTSFNEVMSEYYKRVDYAFSNFATVKITNGVKTERGKAYILYGPPTHIERELSPSSAPKEVWSYESLHKRLIFIDSDRDGNYKLASTESL